MLEIRQILFAFFHVNSFECDAVLGARLVIIRSSTIIIFGCLLLQVSTSEISQQRFGAVAGYSSPITLRCIPFASHLLAAIGKEARELINLS